MSDLVKLIAFYLPQFHPIPENDRWWGKGFTEWTNVTRAKPLFPGHHQPQLPADLGFYDLRVPEVRAEQAALARAAGIHGFCYYHYWFNGKHLLERPFNEVLASGEPDFPFCLCWANENWTRRWDGAEQEVLIGQNYGDDDDRQHIQWLIQAFRDPRYIRVDGRPLILIYRAHHLPNPRRTLDIWRREARKAGIGDLYICRVENFANERDDPHALGFDASIDFQPDWMALPLDHPELSLPDGHVVVDYKNLVQAQLQRPEPAHKRFLGVTPAWDNSARRKKKAFIIANSSPEVYGYWLEQVIRRTMARPAEERLVFVNAWNEWAEGNHLEPDQKFGHAYLDATRNAIAAAGNLQGLVPPPLFKPLELDGYVARTYYEDWLQSRSIGAAEVPHFDRLFNDKAAPRLSVLLDATATDTAALSATLQSVASQQYPHWHLTVFATDKAPAGLHSAQVTWLTVPANAWPACVDAVADGDGGTWHVALRAGETLLPHALLMIAATAAAKPERMVIATDGDWVNEQGQLSRPAPMSGLNPQRLWAQPAWRGLVACRQPLLSQAAADAMATHPTLLRAAILLRALELPPPLAVEHCQFVGVHVPEALGADPGFQARGNLVAAHLAQLGLAANLSPGMTANSQRIQFDYPGGQPPTADIFLVAGHEDLATLQGCIETVLSATAGLPFVLHIPAPADVAADHQAFLQGIADMGLANVRVVPCATTGYAATANRLAAGATGDLLVFLDARCLPLSADWLDTLARHAAQPMTGAVGARLVDAHGAIHTAFIRLGLGGTAASPYVGMSANYEGIGEELQLDQNASAVAGQCLALRKEVLTPSAASTPTAIRRATPTPISACASANGVLAWCGRPTPP